MIRKFLGRFGAVFSTLVLLALLSASVLSDPTFTAGTPPNISQVPLYMRDAVPPLNMLVMGKDHKNYYEAYNDASDLDGDGAYDVGYRGWELKNPAPPAGQSPYKIDYYGYFNSFACYAWDSGNNRFYPTSSTANKRCSGQWSGDFLNYLTTSRMDAMRRVLYGGWRQVDTATTTVLQGAFFPQDAHSWGKEYQSVARDGYDISNYAPLSIPAAGKYHLFAVTTLTDNSAPVFRVMRNSDFRVWNWLSIEGPVAGNKCFTSSNSRTDCVNGGTGTWNLVPAASFQNLQVTTWKRLIGSGSPASAVDMNALFATNAIDANRCGTGAAADINKTADGNPFTGNGCGNDNYLSLIYGQIVISAPGTYRFAVDGDDAVDVTINNVAVASWYGGHGSDRSSGGLDSHSGSITLNAGTYNVVFRHQEAGGGDNWGLFWQNTASANGRDDYYVRVLSCPDTPADARESICKAYPGGNFKPTGILHDYGESQKMYFGLITGSQRNNLEGGVLRRNVSNFADEIDANTGVFKTDVDGIARNIDKLRMIGGGYNGSVTDNSGGDTNWNWANSAHSVGGNCASQGDRALNNGECRMWGNPIAEMMFEAMRYFAGASAPTARFATSGGSSEGTAEDTKLGLSSPDWKDPYKSTANGGLGYPTCAKPYQTVISDINPSYDGDLPGSAFASIASDPAVSGFNASGQGDVIWNEEFGAGARSVFIGEVAGTTDGAPTPKAASSFGNIRGLSPEEPTKGGTYYSASVARYGRGTDLNAASETQNLSTYSVALASPLPTIRFPVGGRVVTLLPFAKTASGTFGGGARKPTNTIVDFYVQKIVNLPGAPSETGSPSDGRPYAVFRINYEDVEQGNDHDMDAIVIYEIKETADGKVEVKLSSEYAAGSADQNIGYSITGTTQDGIYLEVRDRDSTPGTFVPYALNTPNPVLPGGCAGVTTGLCGQQLPLISTRVFTPAAASQDAIQLKNPLWYAAKYGSPGWPVWDQNTDQEPDNYFLVTNPLNLRAQLSKAFDDIARRDIDVGNASISGARVGNSSFTLQPTFRRERNGKDWTGNLSALAIDPLTGGLVAAPIWSAQQKLPPATGATTPANRNIRTMITAGINSAKQSAEFAAANLGANNTAQLLKMGVNPTTMADASQYGATYTAGDMVAYLRGNQSREASAGGTTNTLRTRSTVLGDIINSEPVIASSKSDFGYGVYPDTMFTGYTGTSGYLAQKASRKTVAYVGANDGMLHAFDASTQPCVTPNGRMACRTPDSGTELFAFIPNESLSSIGQLALPDANFNHRYYVDGQLTVGDAKTGAQWKTLLVGAMAAGGQSIFALDVTNPQSFGDDQVLWERNRGVDSDIGNIYGKPLLLPLENGDWGVVFGNGYGGKRSDPSLYILNAFTGDVIRKITANDGNQASNTLTPITDFICSFLPLGDFCARKTDPYNGLGQITAIDADGDGKADTVYGGDLQGNLWKFDLSSTSKTAWGVANAGTALFTAATGAERQPITGGLRVTAGPGSGHMVYFGTGRYFVNGDNNVPATPQVQTLYGVWDNGTSAGGRSSLVQQTITGEATVVDDNGTPGNTADDTTHIVRNISQNLVQFYGTGARRGWYLDLQVGTAAVGERFIAKPLVQSGRVFFTTYTPKQDSCQPGGQNFTYGLDLLSGAGAIANISVLPSNSAVCTNAACGGVGVTSADGSTTQPPITGTGVAAINPITALCPVGGPVTPQCPAPGGPTFEQCQVVIYPGAFVLPRPCGRQSWRQLK